MKRQPSRSVRVHYETLQNTTEHELQRLCNRLGLRFEPQMIAFEQTDPHFLGGNAGPILAVGDAHGIDLRDQYRPSRTFVPVDQAHYEHTDARAFHDERWKRELTLGQIRLFNLLAGRLNRKHGYSTDVSASA